MHAQTKHIYYNKAFIVGISRDPFPLWNCKPISLGCHLRWFIPIFNPFFLFLIETFHFPVQMSRFPCVERRSQFPLWFALVSFQAFWGRPNCLKSVDDSFVLFMSFLKESCLTIHFQTMLFVYHSSGGYADFKRPSPQNFKFWSSKATEKDFWIRRQCQEVAKRDPATSVMLPCFDVNSWQLLRHK